jgi:hypothetical protein
MVNIIQLVYTDLPIAAPLNHLTIAQGDILTCQLNI